MYTKKIISIILAGLFLLANTPTIYPQNQNLASQSLLKRWEEGDVPKKASNGLTRRTFFALLTVGLPAAVILPGCVFDRSGLPAEYVPDSGDGGIQPGIDTGVQPLVTIEYAINAVVDNNNNPVTILQNSVFGDGDILQRLSPFPQFVRSHNAAFRYNGQNWNWTLSNADRQYIIDNGFTYIFNGRSHLLKLAGRDINGQTKTIIFTPQISGSVDYNQPYRVIIGQELIQQLARQIGLDVNTINIYVENLEPEGDFILNGFQKQYAVIATSGEVIPDKISPKWNVYNSEGTSFNATPTAQGINMNFTMVAGDKNQYGGISVPTRSGGINLAKPNLQAAWKMDGDDLGLDSTENENLLTNGNGVVSVPGKYGNAAEFTAANGTYLMIPPESQTNLHITGDLTVSLWVNPSISAMPLVERWSGPLSSPHFVDYVFFLSDAQPSSYDGVTGPSVGEAISLDTWHHLAFVRSPGIVEVYIDGEYKGEILQTFPNTSENLPLYIGWNGGDIYADGLIDEIAIFDKALTPQEIQDIYNEVDSSNFLNPALTTIELKARGNSPFILRLIDSDEQILDVFILDLDPVEWKSITADILQAQEVMNPFFNLGNVESVEIFVEGTFLPAQPGEVFNGTIELDGLVGIPPTTRHRYATDEHDIDMTTADYEYLRNNLKNAEVDLLKREKGVSIMGVKKWEDADGNNILSQNSLDFNVHGRTYSAFTIKSTIYIPHPELINSSITIEDIYIRNKLLKALEIRTSIILNHEIDEIYNPDHKEAVFNEFSKNSINGLNYADVVTVLLETLSSSNITTIDDNFHRQFIANLLMQGMFLDIEGNTYLKIIRELVDDRIDEYTLRQMYSSILGEITGLVTSHRFTHRRLSKEETIITDDELSKEPGFSELSTAIAEIKQGGTIYLDLAKSLIRNNSLATEAEVVTIDFEYLKRLAVFIRRLKGSNVKVIGIYNKQRQDTAIIEQLISIIREDFGLRDEEFPINAVDFNNYLEFISDTRNTVSILTEGSWQAIPDRGQLKIVDSFMDRYNRVNSTGWEFYAALKGLDYNTPQDFLQFIINHVLQQLVAQKVITPENGQRLKDEIYRNGIAFIPTYYDPIQYYKTIESQKALLIAA